MARSGWSACACLFTPPVPCPPHAERCFRAHGLAVSPHCMVLRCFTPFSMTGDGSWGFMRQASAPPPRVILTPDDGREEGSQRPHDTSGPLLTCKAAPCALGGRAPRTYGAEMLHFVQHDWRRELTLYESGTGLPPRVILTPDDRREEGSQRQHDTLGTLLTREAPPCPLGDRAPRTYGAEMLHGVQHDWRRELGLHETGTTHCT